MLTAGPIALCIMNRIDKFFSTWYQPNYSLGPEEWLYIVYLVCWSILAFGVGLLIGLVWTFVV